MKDNLEHLRKLYTEHGLSKSDIYQEKKYNTETNKTENFVLITRTGIEKIIANKGIIYQVFLEEFGSTYATVKVIALFKDEINTHTQTLSSATKENCKFPHYVEIAEKRAIARVVIKLTMGAQYGLMLDEELNDNNLINLSTKPTKKKNPVSGAELKLKNRKSV